MIIYFDCLFTRFFIKRGLSPKYAPNHVQEMAIAKQLPYAVALDPAAEHAKAFGNVRLTPATFLIDKNGMIVMEKLGVLDVPALLEKLKS